MEGSRMNKLQAIKAMTKGKVVRHVSMPWKLFRARGAKAALWFQVSTDFGKTWDNCIIILGEREGWEIVE